MAQYRISGIWKDSSGAITHYAIHEVKTDSLTRGVKTAKSDAVKLVDNTLNTATTYLWNYKTATWNIGEPVHAVEKKFLRSNPDGKVSDNLAHLIDFDWLKL